MRYRSQDSFQMTPVLIIIIINVVFFIGSLINRNIFIGFFGLSPGSFLNQPWTIFTSMFIHASFWHIIFNMLTLYYFGTALSSLVGDKKFLIVYFCGGILGSILFLLLAPSYTTAVGASGAIFAAGGALTVMRPKIKVFLMFIPVPIPLWVGLGIFIILTLPWLMPGIAWQAHLGGLIVGLITGYLFRRSENRYRWR